MDTIRMYLDNLFASVAKTPQVLRAKEELLANMGDRYLDLKAQGKTENEAIGIVISEFGNIDELLIELGVSGAQADADVPLPTAADEDVERYFVKMREHTKKLSWGIALCILSAAGMLFTRQLLMDLYGPSFEDSISNISLIPMFLFIVCGVGLIIYAAMQMDAYKKLEQEYRLSPAMMGLVQREYEEKKLSFTMRLIVGIGMCVISPVPLFVFNAFAGGNTENVYSIVLLLLLVAMGVRLIVNAATFMESYKKMLKLEEYAHPHKKEEVDKVVGIVASIIWPIATLVFLYIGFVRGGWSWGWAVFPIVGIFFGIFNGVYTQVKNQK